MHLSVSHHHPSPYIKERYVYSSKLKPFSSGLARSENLKENIISSLVIVQLLLKHFMSLEWVHTFYKWRLITTALAPLTFVGWPVLVVWGEKILVLKSSLKEHFSAGFVISGILSREGPWSLWAVGTNIGDTWVKSIPEPTKRKNEADSLLTRNLRVEQSKVSRVHNIGYPGYRNCKYRSTIRYHEAIRGYITREVYHPKTTGASALHHKGGILSQRETSCSYTRRPKTSIRRISQYAIATGLSIYSFCTSD